jgi:hypothetical protein
MPPVGPPYQVRLIATADVLERGASRRVVVRLDEVLIAVTVQIGDAEVRGLPPGLIRTLLFADAEVARAVVPEPGLHRVVLEHHEQVEVPVGVKVARCHGGGASS